jgi:catechol 2,3-dioxygenase-like lactoylglutathione lyase family enzyme
MKSFTVVTLACTFLCVSTALTLAQSSAAPDASAIPSDAVLPVVAIHHISIAVPDLDAAIAWYSKIFGLTVEQRMGGPNMGIRGAFLRRPGIRIELWQSLSIPDTPEARRAAPQDMKVMGIKHVAFVVPDLRHALEGLIKNGVKVERTQYVKTEPMLPDSDPLAPGKRRPFSVFISDPFGTWIEMLDGAQVGDGV